LSGLGVGGGGLFVIYLSFFSELEQLQIQGINLAFFLFCATSALAVHVFRRKIFGTAVIVMSLSGIIGALAGTFVSGIVSQLLLRKLFGMLLVISGLISLRKVFKSKEKKG
jgi:uncharacterized membrane protein YfcA